MRKILNYTIIILIVALSLSLSGRSFALVNPSYVNKTAVLSKDDLRRYFEKAMVLFESGRYKEAIGAFENLIEIERSQNEAYFTPFAEIYIGKAETRMKEMVILEDRRWTKMKKDVIDEAQKVVREERPQIAEEREEIVLRDKKIETETTVGQEAEKIARQEEERILGERKKQRKTVQESEDIRSYELEENAEVEKVYEEAMRHYRERNYPAAIVGFKKIKELDPENRLVPQAEFFIEKAQEEIKREKEQGLLARMEAAGRAKVMMEREERRREIVREKLEEEKAKLKEIFKYRLRIRMLKDKIARIEELMDTVKDYVGEERFEEAKETLEGAIAEFPENERFKDILQYVEIQEVKIEENALKRAREITEEKMLLEVAKGHLLPEEKTGVLKKEEKITPLVRIPEIRKRLKIPISIDFKDVELDYVLSFLSDATGVNIVSSSEINIEEKKVNVKIKNMPLEEALKYILKSLGLLYRIEEDAVWVTTKEEIDNEKIETRVYFMEQGIGRFAEFVGTYDEEGGAAPTTEVKTVKDILENAVDWPKDSKLTLDDRTGAFIVTNIPSNLEVVENLLYSLDVTPVQVLIEARFLELKVTDVDELGLEWKLNSAWGTTQNKAKQDIHGFASNSGADFSDFSDSTKDYGFNLTYKGILSHPQFQVVMHALQSKEDVKTLSAPRITTLNNQTATIQITDEYIYPTRYEVSLVQYDINGDGDFDDAGETEWANIPQDFVTRDVGILLHVKPSVGIDGKTVTLALSPEVSESSTSYSYSGSVSIPKFQTRNLSTSVIVKTGETVVMGGLVKETNTKIETKVPLLGDLPFLGAFFRKNTENVERRNLLIFVTATVLNKEEETVVNVPESEQYKREQ